MADSLYLAIDTTSPVASLAVGTRSTVLAQRELVQRSCGENLVPALARLLAAAETSLSDLSGIGVLAGPGSFTGTRIGLATVLGLHQATGIPAGAFGTLQTLAHRAHTEGCEAPVVALVDAFRGNWFAQRFVQGQLFEDRSEPQRLAEAQLKEIDARTFVGHGVSSLVERDVLPPAISVLEVPSLALPLLSRLVEPGCELDPGSLHRPCYVQAPAITQATPRKPSA